MKYILTVPSLTALALTLIVIPAYADHSTDTALTVEPVAMLTSYTEEECEIMSNLTIGARGEEVQCLQRELISDGHLATAATGYFGSITKMALLKWQKEHSVPATGFFGALSRAALHGHAEEVSATQSVTPGAHVHKPLDIASWSIIPTVTMTLHKDALSGFNLQLATTNFTLAPEHVNGVVMPNEGHAHVMIDGVKLTRLYGNWLHIPKEAFTGLGSHEVLVTLNANDHSDLSLSGVRVEARQSIVIE